MLNPAAKPTPRLFLWVLLLATTLIIGLCPLVGLSQQLLESYCYRHAIDDPLSLQKSPVYQIFGEFSIRGTKVHLASVRRMFNTGVRKLSGEDDLALAWRHFIHDDDVVALKFTCVGSHKLGTNRDVAAALLQSLYQAGFKPQNFMLVGLAELPDEAKGTRPYSYGWQKEDIDFGSDRDHLAQWLGEVTAIINIPSLMDDNIIGLRGSLANLTWPLLKKPARLYKNRGDPFVPEIYELPQVRGKIRLHIANALRILYHGGPEFKAQYVEDLGSLIVSTDPVALDRVALELIRRLRREKPLPYGVSEKIAAPYLETAQAMGLGYQDLNFIDYRRIRHDMK